MIVIRTHRKTVVLTGWRAWVVGIAALLVAWLVLAFLAFVLVGIAATLGVVLLLIVPAALIVVGLQSVLGRGRS